MHVVNVLICIGIILFTLVFGVNFSLYVCGVVRDDEVLEGMCGLCDRKT